MNITIIAVGKIKEDYIKNGIKEYIKRMTPYAKINIVEIPDEKAPKELSAKEEKIIIEKEGKKILDKIKKDNFKFSLCIEGEEMDSLKFAQELKQIMDSGNSDVAFIIGGSLGLSEEIKDISDIRLSFSKMTFPHQLMRLILIEQIYRAFKINRNETYHK
ncbi:MAG: 23S rRNA (pseudouridine(1915)-N(3))-methyltransferase RlmH [Minisyncoccia bacterium]